MRAPLGMVASAYQAPAAAFLFSETFAQANDTHWDYLKWMQQRSGTFNVTSNKGIFVGSGGPGQTYTDQVITDAEILVKWQWTATLTGSDFPEIGWRISQGTMSGNGVAGYLIQLNGSSGKVDIYKIGAYSSIGNATDATLKTAGTRWFKIRTVGNNHKVRWWTDGNSEPSTWQIDVNDASSTYTYGCCALRSYSTVSLTVHSFQITDLATPATPADGSLRDLSGGQAATGSTFNFSSADLTMCTWFKSLGTTGSSQPIIGVSAGGSYFILGMNSLGALSVSMNPSDFAPGYTPPVGTWVFAAVVRLLAGGIEVYYAPSGSGLTKATSALTGTPNGTVTLFKDTFGVASNTCIVAPRIWTAALSQAELTAEMSKAAAQRTANLWGSWQYQNGWDYVDYSGNGRVLTFIGGIGSGPVGAPIT